MALRNGCYQAGRLVHLAAAALISASALLFAGAPAEAHHYRHYRGYPRAAHAGHYPRYAHRAHTHTVRQASTAVPASPAFSTIVVDANSGRTLYSADEDGLRHPASITKVMTLYLLFEALDRGAITLHTPIPISEHAAAQEPSKLGLRPGETISVEDAIKAVVTRSANDVAVAIAESIGQTEDNFADMMTRKARALGMSSTIYRNASGLPNDEQVTTARDLTTLGRSLEERFPRYFRYFSTAQFEYGGEVIGNHNHLLGRVDGVDGIKTGYTRASGFNLLTSVHRDGRSLIAVVMGGRSAAGRDRIMENLIADHLAEASTERTATMIAEAAPAEGTDLGAEPPARPRPAAAPQRVADQNAGSEIAEGDTAAGDEAPAPQAAAARPAPADLGWAKGADDAGAPKAPWSARAAKSSPAATPLEKPRDPEADRRPRHKGTAGRSTIVASAKSQPAPQAKERDGAAPHEGWTIQIGATDDPAKANALLIRARERNRSTLASAKPVTEKVHRGEDTVYRARFAMLDSTAAESACRSLKQNGFSCFPARD
jgi:D-alanyl-D-alanine carboxypeptidase